MRMMFMKNNGDEDEEGDEDDEDDDEQCRSPWEGHRTQVPKNRKLQ